MKRKQNREQKEEKEAPKKSTTRSYIQIIKSANRQVTKEKKSHPFL